jgi:hypothetical protein
VTSVRWFDPNGTVLREVTGSQVDVNPCGGYVSEITGDAVTCHAVNGDWNVILPKKPTLLDDMRARVLRKGPGDDGYVAWTTDSTVLVWQYYPHEGEIIVEMYFKGRRIAAIGPYVPYKGEQINLSSDGSLALLARKTQEDKGAHVLAVSPDGKVRIEAKCGQSVCSPIAAPAARGVLVQSNLPSNGYDTFVFYDKSGGVSSLRIGPNPTFLAWVPTSSKSVFLTSVGCKYRYQLIDWESGTIVWDVPDPAAGLWERAVPRRVVLGDYVLLCGLEFMKLGEREGPVRSIYALHLTNGETVAHWLPAPNCHFSTDWGKFVRLGRKLFILWGAEFAEIKLEDIAAKKNGWREPEQR